MGLLWCSTSPLEVSGIRLTGDGTSGTRDWCACVMTAALLDDSTKDSECCSAVWVDSSEWATNVTVATRTNNCEEKSRSPLGGPGSELWQEPLPKASVGASWRPRLGVVLAVGSATLASRPSATSGKQTQSNAEPPVWRSRRSTLDAPEQTTQGASGKTGGLARSQIEADVLQMPFTKRLPSKGEAALNLMKARAAHRQQLLDAFVGPDEVLLQSGKVSPETQVLYQTKLNTFLAEAKLSDTAPAKELDLALQRKFVAYFVAGLSIYHARILYYAARWKTSYTNLELRRAYAAMQGHRRREKERTQDPETWEALRLQVGAVLSVPRPP